MRVTVYDKNPGAGFSQWFLKTCWELACWFQKLVGAVDAYYGAKSWEDAQKWLLEQKRPLTVIQYWGHGSPASVWLAQKLVPASEWLSLKPAVVPETLLWFRACSVFQNMSGQSFSQKLANGLGCTIAGHTFVIGPFQGGLHTRRPNTEPSWPFHEGTLKSKWPDHLKWWNPNTIFCLRTKIPEGW